MSKSLDSRAPATTFLTHFFGGGLVDEGKCYVVERFKAMSNGEIRRRAKPEVAPVDAVRDMRPARNEIIVCTGLGTRSGVQVWGDIATGMFHDRKQHR